MAFGRFQPIHKGHAQVINKVIAHAKKIGAEHQIYASRSEGDKKNPIPYKEKVNHLRSLFPEANIVDDPEAISPHHVLRKLSNQGHKDVTMVVGSDRTKEFKQEIGKYVKSDKEPGYDPQKHYNIDKFDVISAGHRNPEAPDIEGISGTKMRQFVHAGDFKSFAKNTPTTNVHLAKKIFNSVKRNLKEAGEEEEELHESIDHKTFGPMLDNFVDFASNHLDIQTKPPIKLKNFASKVTSFGGYKPASKEIEIVTGERHPMDVFRTVAHELVHHKQNEDGRLTSSEDGNTGSDIENEANSEAGKILRYWAKKQPGAFDASHVGINDAIFESYLSEGINDPSIFKVVFLAGSSGSGKDYILHKAIDGNGLTEINSDRALEFLMKKSDLSLLMPDTEREKRELVRGRAKNISRERQRLALNGRHGLVINGTADDPEKLNSIKTQLEQLGYDSMMVFVDTSDEVSKLRNINRGKEGGRQVPEDIRASKWAMVQKHRETLRNLFGENRFSLINNNIDTRNASPEKIKDMDQEFTKVFKKVKAFTKEAPTKKVAWDWIKSEVDNKGVTNYVPPKHIVSTPVHSLRSKIASRKIKDHSASSEEADKLGLTYYGFGRYGKSINGTNIVTHISKNGRLIAKAHDLKEEKENMEKNKKKEPSFGEAIATARTSGSLSFDHGGKKHSTKHVGELADAWLKKMELERNKNPMTPPPMPKIKPVKPAKPGTREANQPGTVAKDVQGNPMNTLLIAHKNRKALGVDRAFQAFAEEHGAGDWGTKKLLDKYIQDTPGQFVRKLKQEEANLGVPSVGSGLDDTYDIDGGSVGGISGLGYSFPAMFESQLPNSESIKEWALKEETKARFIQKYGTKAAEKLLETARSLASLT